MMHIPCMIKNNARTFNNLRSRAILTSHRQIIGRYSFNEEIFKINPSNKFNNKIMGSAQTNFTRYSRYDDNISIWYCRRRNIDHHVWFNYKMCWNGSNFIKYELNMVVVCVN